MRTYKEENSSSMFSTEILQENTEAAFDRGHHTSITNNVRPSLPGRALDVLKLFRKLEQLLVFFLCLLCGHTLLLQRLLLPR